MRQYKIMYRSLLVVHLLWALLMIACIPLMLMFEWARIPAMFIALTNIIVWLFYNGDCPLQMWENELHAKYAPHKMYNKFFTQHYVQKIFKISIPAWFANSVMYGGMAAVLIIGLVKAS